MPGCHKRRSLPDYWWVPERDQLTDDRLLQEAQSDASAFGVFYRRHSSGVFAYFLRRLARRDLAADLTAEVFAAAFEAVLDGHHAGRPDAWLYGIARHKLIDSLRAGRVEDRARRRLGVPTLTLTDAELERTEELIDLEREQAKFERLLATLPDSERAALEARVVGEEAYPLIAARLKCSEALVRQRVSRGLRHLRNALEADG